jgi:hypothetical protein
MNMAWPLIPVKDLDSFLWLRKCCICVQISAIVKHGERSIDCFLHKPTDFDHDPYTIRQTFLHCMHGVVSASAFTYKLLGVKCFGVNSTIEDYLITTLSQVLLWPLKFQV